VSNLKSVSLTVLELLAFYAQKFRGHATVATPLWVMSILLLGICVSNLKSVALTVLELLAFNAKKLGGHVTVATPPFGKIFGDRVLIVPGKTCVKFEFCSFNRFGAISILRPKI